MFQWVRFVLNYIHVTFFSGWLRVSLELGVIFNHVSGGGPAFPYLVLGVAGPALPAALPLVGACIARGSQPHQHLLLIKVSHCHLQPPPTDFTSDSQKDSPFRTRSGGAEALVHYGVDLPAALS